MQINQKNKLLYFLLMFNSKFQFMKKFLLAIALVASAMTANAEQALKLGNFTDNWYIGIGGGAATSLRFKEIFPINSTATIFLGKQVTPVVGLELEGTAWFGSNAYDPDTKSSYRFNQTAPYLQFSTVKTTVTIFCPSEGSNGKIASLYL